MSQKWIVKPRNYELDTVKYEAKLKPIMKDQDPLSVDITALHGKKKKIRKRIANPLEGNQRPKAPMFGTSTAPQKKRRRNYPPLQRQKGRRPQ